MTVLLISTVFVIAINFSIRSKQADILRSSLDKIHDTFFGELNQKNLYFEVPFNVLYTIYNDDEEILYSNDSFIPFLEDTNGKAKKFVEKNYFSDGDLNILYVAKTFPKDQSEITIVAALDVDKDYGSDFFKELPKMILAAIVPILLLSFAVAVYITKKMTKPFERERQFSNDVSHELKTPLAVINGQTSLLLRWGKNDPKLLEESLISIKKETKSMQSIIENLSEISRYESGRLTPVLTEFSAGELFERLKNETETFCTKENEEKPKNYSFKIDIKQDFFIKSDEELLHQVMTILITNSLKFNMNNCEIVLRAEKKGKQIILEEEDDGIGIDEKIMPYIFDRFYRGDSSHNQKIPGSGLGLSIAKTIITILNGKISVRKNHSGSGVVFRIVL